MLVGIISPYIIAIAAAWVAAQGTKYVINLIKTRSFSQLRQLLFVSGGMPSSHSSIVVAVTVLIGLHDGMQSGLFGLAVLLATIVMYDAVKVRRSSGEQGLALRALLREQGSEIALPRAAQGHTPVEVLVGATLGVAIGIVVFLATR